MMRLSRAHRKKRRNKTIIVVVNDIRWIFINANDCHRPTNTSFQPKENAQVTWTIFSLNLISSFRVRVESSLVEEQSSSRSLPLPTTNQKPFADWWQNEDYTFRKIFGRISTFETQPRSKANDCEKQMYCGCVAMQLWFALIRMGLLLFAILSEH